MQKSKLWNQVNYLIEEIQSFFSDKVKNFAVLDFYDNDNTEEFSVEFEAYSYFYIRINYDKGKLAFAVETSDHLVFFPFDSFWETADFDVLFQDLQEEIELRIPDKFLKVHGWLKK